MVEIYQEDIKNAESLLLPAGEVFSQERKDILTCLETKDIKACPGSGKTTTLLAKLYIISKQLPLKDNSGICVLTHTNVASNEIKTKLGVNGAKLFRHPNNCSTIQSFVNQYLAIPAYINFYAKRPVTIDDDFYNEKLLNKYYEIVPPRLRYGIEKVDPGRIYKMRFNVSSGDLTNGMYGDPFYKNKNNDTYKYLMKLKSEMLNLGILCYDDAYYLAYYYLNKYPQLKRVFSKRFSYVFIDEMQDTMSHQNDLLNSMFDDSVIIQRIGDKNQAIYDHQEGKEAWEINDPSLSISESKRFSQAIASTVKSVCVTPQDLKGNPSIPNIQPTIIVFTKSTIDKVLPHFANIILRNELEKEINPVFKAVSWVTKEHENHDTLLDYWKSFDKNVKQRIDFDYLISYLTPVSLEYLNKKGVALYKQSILRGILKAIKLMGEQDKSNKFFTTKFLLDFLQEEHKEIYEKLSLKLAKWCLAIHKKCDVHLEIKKFIETDLKCVFNWQRIDQLNDFFRIEDEKQEVTTSLSHNTFTFPNSKKDIEIQLDSVHGVKGETHTATLYLETFFYNYDVYRIINYLKGNHKNTNQKLTLQNLKVTYVGFTRPTHMLCVAVHQETIETHEEDLKRAGWNIEHV